MASQTVSTLRFAAFRSQCLSLAKSCSIGLRSGEYFGRKKSLAPACSDRAAHGLALVAPRLSMTTMSPGWSVGDENLLDIEEEPLAVDRPVDEPGRVDAVMAQRGQEGHGLPVAIGHFGLDPLSDRRPAPERGHVGLGPGLVDEHQAGGVDPVLIQNPLRPPARHVGTILLGGDQRLFLCDSPSACTNSHTER